MPLSIRQVGDTIFHGQDPVEYYTKIFKDISKHFEQHAERYAQDAVEVHAGMVIQINLPISEIITISVTTEELLKRNYMEG